MLWLVKVINYKEDNILPNYAFYLSFSQKGTEVVAAFNFCIKNKNVNVEEID